ncbi:NADPH-dependent FMN reductase [Croceitalea rosinachiae]|uniref:NAD(P)H-dependent oxidoreductase n=1 Tax=Croceitalea rosinachiae TaxID=3075596 RepID=A0ABU3AF78_9FLAO|nr:NAD(P)H-dependent oxidoreductase [Croceitalea sp. F388]MDT0607753.1 NAD(P)H-dependent oxidoreductase [Croceitalea sp. F388]
MAKILVFAGSNSSASINYELVKYTASIIENHDIQLLNMANYPFALYSEDIEKKEGYSNSLVELKNDIQNADGIILAVNEHNGNPSAYFKNILDWLSRLERKFMSETKVLLMSTSPGKRGGIGALEIVNTMLPRFGAEIVTTFSLPSFHDNFSPSKGISDTELSDIYEKALEAFLNSL